MRYLLDTCVISELAAKKPDSRVVAWIDSIDPEVACLSVITIGEIQRGIERVGSVERRIVLQKWLDIDLLNRFEGRILVLDIKTMIVWGHLTASMQIAGTPLPAVDSMLAATALRYDCVLVTRNERDFIPSGVTVLNPWKKT